MPCPRQTSRHDWPYPSLSLQCTELRSTNEKQGREVRSLGSELAALKEDGDGGGAAGRRVSLMSLAAMEKIQVGGGRDEGRLERVSAVGRGGTQPASLHTSDHTSHSMCMRWKS